MAIREFNSENTIFTSGKFTVQSLFSLNNTLKLLIIVVTQICIFSLNSVAAPHPGAGSSALTDAKKGYFFPSKNFTVSSGNTNWLVNNDDTHSLNQISIRFNSPNKSGSVSIKTDNLTADFNSESYARRWLKDFAHFGFEVLGSQPFALKKERGFVIDLYHRKKMKQLRQAVFVKDKTAVIFTCSDDRSKFSDTLKGCNSIIKSFSWNEIDQNKAK